MPWYKHAPCVDTPDYTDDKTTSGAFTLAGSLVGDTDKTLGVYRLSPQ